MSGNMMELDFVRPECLFQGAGVSPYFVFTIGACVFILSLLAMCRIAKLLVAWLGPLCMGFEKTSKWVDTIEFVHSIFFSGQLTPTWTLATMLILTIRTGGVYGPLGGAVASASLACPLSPRARSLHCLCICDCPQGDVWAVPLPHPRSHTLGI